MKRRMAGIFAWLGLSLCSVLGAEQVLVYLRLTDALTLDPGKFEDFYSHEAIANVFEGLVRLRPGTTSVEPCLAERWTIQDNGRRWTFHLRRGVRFHDGSEFNAQAVVHSLRTRMENRSGEYGAFARVFPMIADVRAEGDWSVDIVLSRPYGSFLLSLIDLRSAIIAPVSGAGLMPVGTGPFKLSEWAKGRSMVLERHPSYWDAPPRIDKVVLRSESAASLRVTQIRNGSAQAGMLRSATERENLADRPDIGVISHPSLSTGYLGFNCSRPPFRHRQVREAFAHLLNKEIMVRRIFQNLAQPADSFLPPQMPGFDPQGGRREFSPQKARRLLQEAGLSQGFRCTLYYTEGQFGIEEIARVIAANARMIRVTVVLMKLPFERSFRAVQDGEADLFLMTWGHTVDPVVYLNPMFMLVPSNGRMMSIGPEYARVLSSAEKAVGKEEQEAFYRQAQRLLSRELPLLPLFHLNEMVAYSKRVSGLRLDPLGFLLFRDARFAPE